uniref:GATA-type domain-containing protein n=1 Tax=Mycena chlorophos TaxID=658473 RepID=A0ABQ0LS07_MYCCL|nr:predicted protein [Mycena chlorophos]
MSPSRPTLRSRAGAQFVALPAETMAASVDGGTRWVSLENDVNDGVNVKAPGPGCSERRAGSRWPPWSEECGQLEWTMMCRVWPLEEHNESASRRKTTKIRPRTLRQVSEKRPSGWLSTTRLSVSAEIVAVGPCSLEFGFNGRQQQMHPCSQLPSLKSRSLRSFEFIPERKHVCLSYGRDRGICFSVPFCRRIIDIDPLRADSVAYQAALPEHGTHVWAKGDQRKEFSTASSLLSRRSGHLQLPGPPRVLELLPMSRSSRSTGPRGAAGYGYDQYGRAQTPAQASSGYAEYTWPPPMSNDQYAQQRPQTAIGFRETSQASSTIGTQLALVVASHELTLCEDPRYLQHMPMRSHTPGPGAYQSYRPPPPIPVYATYPPPVPPVSKPLAQAGPGFHHGLYNASDMGTGSQSPQPVLDPAPARRITRREGNFIISTNDPSASGRAAPPDVCPTCLSPAPTTWRFGKVSERMVCQPCSLYERRNGIKRTPEHEAQKLLRATKNLNSGGGRR